LSYGANGRVDVIFGDAFGSEEELMDEIKRRNGVVSSPVEGQESAGYRPQETVSSPVAYASFPLSEFPRRGALPVSSGRAVLPETRRLNEHERYLVYDKILSIGQNIENTATDILAALSDESDVYVYYILEKLNNYFARGSIDEEAHIIFEELTDPKNEIVQSILSRLQAKEKEIFKQLITQRLPTHRALLQYLQEGLIVTLAEASEGLSRSHNYILPEKIIIGQGFLNDKKAIFDKSFVILDEKKLKFFSEVPHVQQPAHENWARKNWAQKNALNIWGVAGGTDPSGRTINEGADEDVAGKLQIQLKDLVRSLKSINESNLDQYDDTKEYKKEVIHIDPRHRFSEKIVFLKAASYGHVVLLGGPETQDLLSEVLDLIKNGKIKEFPVVLVGTEKWKGFFDWMTEAIAKQGLIRPKDLKLVRFADTAQEAVKHILHFHAKSDLSVSKQIEFKAAPQDRSSSPVQSVEAAHGILSIQGIAEYFERQQIPGSAGKKESEQNILPAFSAPAYSAVPMAVVEKTIIAVDLRLIPYKEITEIIKTVQYIEEVVLNVAVVHLALVESILGDLMRKLWDWVKGLLKSKKFDHIERQFVTDLIFTSNVSLPSSALSLAIDHRPLATDSVGSVVHTQSSPVEDFEDAAWGPYIEKVLKDPAHPKYAQYKDALEEFIKKASEDSKWVAIFNQLNDKGQEIELVAAKVKTEEATAVVIVNPKDVVELSVEEVIQAAAQLIKEEISIIREEEGAKEEESGIPFEGRPLKAAPIHPVSEGPVEGPAEQEHRPRASKEENEGMLVFVRDLKTSKGDVRGVIYLSPGAETKQGDDYFNGTDQHKWTSGRDGPGLPAGSSARADAGTTEARTYLSSSNSNKKRESSSRQEQEGSRGVSGVQWSGLKQKREEGSKKIYERISVARDRAVKMAASVALVVIGPMSWILGKQKLEEGSQKVKDGSKQSEEKRRPATEDGSTVSDIVDATSYFSLLTSALPKGVWPFLGAVAVSSPVTDEKSSNDQVSSPVEKKQDVKAGDLVVEPIQIQRAQPLEESVSMEYGDRMAKALSLEIVPDELSYELTYGPDRYFVERWGMTQKKFHIFKKTSVQLIRVGYLFFLDTAMRKRLPQDLIKELGSNIIYLSDLPATEIGGNIMDYTVATILALLHNDMKGLHVIDAGAGQGIMALIAARLGAAQVDLVEIKSELLAKARENIRQNEGPDRGDSLTTHVLFRLLQGDLNNSEQIARRLNVLDAPHGLAIISTIALWPFNYSGTSHMIIDLAEQISNISMIIFGDYNKMLEHHQEIIEHNQNQVRSMGLTVASKEAVLQRGVAIAAMAWVALDSEKKNTDKNRAGASSPVTTQKGVWPLFVATAADIEQSFPLYTQMPERVDYEGMGRYIEHLIDQRGTTPEALTKEIHMTPLMLNRIIGGKEPLVKLDDILKIAEYFDRPLIQLVTAGEIREDKRGAYVLPLDRTMVGKNFKRIRLARGVESRQIADAVGIDYTYLSAIERGRRIPTLSLFVALAYAYKVNPEYLLSRFTLYEEQVKELSGQWDSVLGEGESDQMIRKLAKLYLLKGETRASVAKGSGLTAPTILALEAAVESGELHEIQLKTIASLAKYYRIISYDFEAVKSTLWHNSRVLRQYRGWTQKASAAQVDISLGALEKIESKTESNRLLPFFSVVTRMAGVYTVPLNVLLGHSLRQGNTIVKIMMDDLIGIISDKYPHLILDNIESFGRWYIEDPFLEADDVLNILQVNERQQALSILRMIKQFTDQHDQNKEKVSSPVGRVNTEMDNRRWKVLEGMQKNIYDVLIIGGGINGAWSALKLAEQGRRVALIEKGDFGSGTSSKSTNIAHGGLRYLEQAVMHLGHGQIGQGRAHLGLLQEALQERERLFAMFKDEPELVRPEPFYFPVYRGDRRMFLWVRLGVWMYDYLAGLEAENLRRHSVLTGEAARNKIEELGLKSEGLTGILKYWDGHLNGVKLVQRVVADAAKAGADVINYTRAGKYPLQGKDIYRVNMQDVLTGGSYKIRTKSVVLALGPWMDGIEKKRGTHITVTPRLTSANIIRPSTRGSVLFILPQGDRSYIGTTDVVSRGDADDIRAPREDIDYLINETNRNLSPEHHITPTHVVDAIAGERAFALQNGSNDPSRDIQIVQDDGVFKFVGTGKLTTAQHSGEKMADAVIDYLNRRPTSSPVAKNPSEKMSNVKRKKYQNRLSSPVERDGTQEPAQDDIEFVTAHVEPLRSDARFAGVKVALVDNLGNKVDVNTQSLEDQIMDGEVRKGEGVFRFFDWHDATWSQIKGQFIWNGEDEFAYLIDKGEKTVNRFGSYFGMRIAGGVDGMIDTQQYGAKPFMPQMYILKPKTQGDPVIEVSLNEMVPMIKVYDIASGNEPYYTKAIEDMIGYLTMNWQSKSAEDIKSEMKDLFILLAEKGPLNASGVFPAVVRIFRNVLKNEAISQKVSEGDIVEALMSLYTTDFGTVKASKKYNIRRFIFISRILGELGTDLSQGRLIKIIKELQGVEDSSKVYDLARQETINNIQVNEFRWLDRFALSRKGGRYKYVLKREAELRQRLMNDLKGNIALLGIRYPPVERRVTQIVRELLNQDRDLVEKINERRRKEKRKALKSKKKYIPFLYSEVPGVDWDLYPAREAVKAVEYIEGRQKYLIKRLEHRVFNMGPEYKFDGPHKVVIEKEGKNRDEYSINLSMGEYARDGKAAIEGGHITLLHEGRDIAEIRWDIDADKDKNEIAVLRGINILPQYRAGAVGYNLGSMLFGMALKFLVNNLDINAVQIEIDPSMDKDMPSAASVRRLNNFGFVPDPATKQKLIKAIERRRPIELGWGGSEKKNPYFKMMVARNGKKEMIQLFLAEDAEHSRTAEYIYRSMIKQRKKLIQLIRDDKVFIGGRYVFNEQNKEYFLNHLASLPPFQSPLFEQAITYYQRNISDKQPPNDEEASSPVAKKETAKWQAMTTHTTPVKISPNAKSLMDKKSSSSPIRGKDDSHLFLFNELDALAGSIAPDELQLHLDQLSLSSIKEAWNKFSYKLPEDFDRKVASIAELSSHVSDRMLVQLYEVLKTILIDHPDLSSGMDMRPVMNDLLAAPFVGYDMAIARIVNSENRDLRGIYLGAGGDISNFLLSTNAVEGYFVDNGYVSDTREHFKMWHGYKYMDDYKKIKYYQGYASSTTESGFRERLAFISYFDAIVAELSALGVGSEDLVRIEHYRNRFGYLPEVSVTFNWAYHGQKSKRRVIHFISGELNEVYDQLPVVDFYYQRAGRGLPLAYENIINQIIRKIIPGGYLVFDNHVFNYGKELTRDPKDALDNPDILEPKKNDAIQFLGRYAYAGLKLLGEYGWKTDVYQLVPGQKGARPLFDPRIKGSSPVVGTEKINGYPHGKTRASSPVHAADIRFSRAIPHILRRTIYEQLMIKMSEDMFVFEEEIEQIYIKLIHSDIPELTAALEAPRDSRLFRKTFINPVVGKTMDEHTQYFYRRTLVKELAGLRKREHPDYLDEKKYSLKQLGEIYREAKGRDKFYRILVKHVAAGQGQYIFKVRLKLEGEGSPRIEQVVLGAEEINIYYRAVKDIGAFERIPGMFDRLSTDRHEQRVFLHRISELMTHKRFKKYWPRAIRVLAQIGRTDPYWNVYVINILAEELKGNAPAENAALRLARYWSSRNISDKKISRLEDIINLLSDDTHSSPVLDESAKKILKEARRLGGPLLDRGKRLLGGVPGWKALGRWFQAARAKYKKQFGMKLAKIRTRFHIVKRRMWSFIILIVLSFKPVVLNKEITDPPKTYEPPQVTQSIVLEEKLDWGIVKRAFPEANRLGFDMLTTMINLERVVGLSLSTQAGIMGAESDLYHWKETKDGRIVVRKSGAGAYGLMQVTPIAADEVDRQLNKARRLAVVPKHLQVLQKIMNGEQRVNWALSKESPVYNLRVGVAVYYLDLVFVREREIRRKLDAGVYRMFRKPVIRLPRHDLSDVELALAMYNRGRYGMQTHIEYFGSNWLYDPDLPWETGIHNQRFKRYKKTFKPEDMLTNNFVKPYEESSSPVVSKQSEDPKGARPLLGSSSPSQRSGKDIYRNRNAGFRNRLVKQRARAKIQAKQASLTVKGAGKKKCSVVVMAPVKDDLLHTADFHPKEGEKKSIKKQKRTLKKSGALFREKARVKEIWKQEGKSSTDVLANIHFYISVIMVSLFITAGISEYYRLPDITFGFIHFYEAHAIYLLVSAYLLIFGKVDAYTLNIRVKADRVAVGSGNTLRSMDDEELAWVVVDDFQDNTVPKKLQKEITRWIDQDSEFLAKLRYVLKVLLGNAVHAVRSQEPPEGGIVVTIGQEEKQLTLVIEDDGIWDSSVDHETESRILNKFIKTVLGQGARVETANRVERGLLHSEKGRAIKVMIPPSVDKSSSPVLGDASSPVEKKEKVSKISIDSYMNDIDEAGRKGLITYTPQYELYPAQLAHFPHVKMIEREGWKNSLTSSNASPFSVYGKKVYEYILRIQTDHTLKIFDMGAGAGFATSHMSRIAQAFGIRVIVDLIGLVPFAPRFRWKASLEDIEERIYGNIHYRDILLELALNLQYKQQDQEKGVVDLFSEPFVNHQYIGKFLDDEVIIKEKYDFMYDSLGAFHYSFAGEFKKTIEKTFSLLSEEGIFFYAGILSPELFEWNEMGVPKGFAVISTSQWAGGGGTLIMKKESRHYKKIVSRLPREIDGGYYLVENFEKILEYLIKRESPEEGQALQGHVSKKDRDRDDSTSSSPVDLTEQERIALEPVYENTQQLLDALPERKKNHSEEKLLFVARHEESASNLFEFLQTYESYSPLTFRGLKQRAELARFFRKNYFGFDRYIHSGLERAYETIRLLAQQNGTEPERLRRFREVLFESWGGDLQNFVRHPEEFSIEGYSGRKVKKYLNIFLDEFTSGEDENVMIATHGMLKLIMLMHILDIASPKYNSVFGKLGNAPHGGITVFAYNPKENYWQLLVYGDDSYMPPKLRGKTTHRAVIAADTLRFYSLAVGRLLFKRFGRGRGNDFVTDYYPTRDTFGLPSKEKEAASSPVIGELARGVMGGVPVGFPSWPWQVFMVPGRRWVDILVALVEEPLVVIRRHYIFWAASRKGYTLLDFIFNMFVRVWMLITELLNSLMRRVRWPSTEGADTLTLPVIKTVVNPGWDMGHFKGYGHGTKEGPIDKGPPVGAVVRAMSSPVKGGPEDAVWMRFYRNKLNPETPGHQKYLNDFVELYQSSSEGSKWYKFFKKEERIVDSPWQIVFQTANKDSEIVNVSQTVEKKTQTAFSQEGAQAVKRRVAQNFEAPLWQGVDERITPKWLRLLWQWDFKNIFVQIDVFVDSPQHFVLSLPQI